MKDFDNLLNRYIDGELSNSEKMEFERLLQSSAELQEKYDAMIGIDKILRKAEPESPSNLFTANVMKSLKRTSTSVKSQNYFILSVTGLFVLISFAIIGYALSLIFNSPAENSGSFEISHYLEFLTHEFISFASNLFHPKYFTYIGSLAATILLVTGYFFFENHRKLLKKNIH